MMIHFLGYLDPLRHLPIPRIKSLIAQDLCMTSPFFDIVNPSTFTTCRYHINVTFTDTSHMNNLRGLLLSQWLGREYH